MADKTSDTAAALRYRDASEALHRASAAGDRYLPNLRMLGACGYTSLIRDDFYRLLGFTADRRGDLLDAGCGSGVDLVNLRRLAPGLRLHGVDISSVLLGLAVQRPGLGSATLYQAALESLPFADRAFDAVASHEVVEHVEDPAVALAEMFRVLKPGGICVVATPNGASLWPEHVRQRLARLSGRRGAPVGSDHARPPAFWRRTFAQAGFAVERQIFDAAAIEFQTYVAPAGWMPRLGRLLEPLRAVPVLRLLLCDRVKFRLRKPDAPAAPGSVALRCPVCGGAVAEERSGAVCRNGHRYGRIAAGAVDFLAPLGTAAPAGEASPGAAPSAADRRPFSLARLVRRGFILAYALCLLPLLPLGYVAGRCRQPFDRIAKDAWTV